MTFAVIQTGGKQYKVKASEILKIERLKDASDKIEFICDDLETYRIANDKYDLIWSDTVIELP